MYDVFGNRLTESKNVTTNPGCGGGGIDSSTFAIDNALVRTKSLACSRVYRYFTDRAGNRLAQLDSATAGGVSYGPQHIMSYTALNQLYFSMTQTGQTGTYDYNWHLYDAGGTRIETIVRSGQSYVPGTIPPDTLGVRTFFVYDGPDVRLSVVKSGSTWWLYQRYMTGGLDDQVAGRFAQNFSATAQNLVLVGDYQGSTVAAVKSDGTQETNATYFSHGPFGASESPSGTGGSTNPGTGFTGASTPNATGGFVYLRNRWYDPKTGRFLTQDPIGLAGGVKIYAYAGSNPVAFADPFGLCPDSLTGRPCQNILAGATLQLRTDVPSGFGVIPERNAGIHQGADYLASYGIQNVTAADEGEVDRVDNDPDGFGNYVQLRHRNAEGEVVSYTLYGHLAEASNLRNGQAVRGGQVIGNAGNSGNAVNTPTHVHFEIRTQSRPGGGLANRMDPVPQFRPRPMNLFALRF